MISFGRHGLWKYSISKFLLYRTAEKQKLYIFSGKYGILQCYLITLLKVSLQHLIMLWRTSINDNYQFRNTESDCTCFGTESCLRHVRWRHLHALSEVTNKSEACVAPVSRRMPSPAKRRKRWGYCEKKRKCYEMIFFFFLGEKVKNRYKNFFNSTFFEKMLRSFRKQRIKCRGFFSSTFSQTEKDKIIRYIVAW